MAEGGSEPEQSDSSVCVLLASSTGRLGKEVEGKEMQTGGKHRLSSSPPQLMTSHPQDAPIHEMLPSVERGV